MLRPKEIMQRAGAVTRGMTGHQISTLEEDLPAQST